MRKKKKVKKIDIKKVQRVLEQQPERSNNLILGGILLAMISIGLLIFVLSVKYFT